MASFPEPSSAPVYAPTVSKPERPDVVPKAERRLWLAHVVLVVLVVLGYAIFLLLPQDQAAERRRIDDAYRRIDAEVARETGVGPANLQE